MRVPKVSGGLDAGSGDPLSGACTAIAYVAGNGAIFLWSPQAEALLGYPAEEVCGKPAVDLLTAREDREAAVAAQVRHTAGQSWDGVLGMRHRDGHQVSVAVRVRPLLSKEGQAGWSVRAADARAVEREEADRAILEALFSQSPIPVTVMDTELRYLWVNAATERVTDLPSERLIGRRIGDDSPDSAPTIDRVLSRVRDTGEPVVDFQVLGRLASDPDREHVFSASSFRLTDGAGRVLGMCQTYIDVTDGYQAQQRLALLTEAGVRIGTTLDVMRTAQELADAAVPGLADFVAIDLLEATVRGEEPAPGPVAGEVRARRSGLRSIREHAPEAVFVVGETVAFHPGTPQVRSLATGQSVLVRKLDADEWFAHDSRRAEKIRAFRFHSYMTVPLRARGITLGVATLGRNQDLRPYDEGDLSLAEDFSSRAAVCIDNARRYTREHNTALALQHSLLPHDLPDYPAVETAHRYLPAAAHAGAGGDWFDVLPLSGARVALVVGDVTGHGLHAAAVMGRLRTAVHTLADLDLPPDEVLTQLDDLVIRLIEEDPDCEGATCLYSVYDPISRICAFARAGHPPPVLVQPDGAVEILDDIPPGPPLGLGGLPFETAERRLADSSVLALYTDGLIEAPGWDVDAGLDRLSRTMAGPTRPLEQLCDAVVASLLSEHRSDDAALLLARTRVLGAGRVVSWKLPVDPAQVAHARNLTTRQLATWGLEPLTFTTELMVSELVTNAIRHARGPIVLRLIHAAALICEVSDGSLSAPHLRRARTGDEGGRGLFLVAQLASRWGTRYDRDGKTIWAEQALSPVEAPTPAL
ncbi:SpoIIE family protein phosphatase [Streptomyces sp. NBC_00841]|uniref:SpoIIE family protein phosphatase n=1 Tax=Streptomyces sp. NBC_00841 TaxID=2975847 RepID=UPI002DD7A628|nr:SpoIIE family protein phosphatase [Streptomyces sp. NBC_00841]WSA03320.1 SpoIIE family protein phosphatase [Streptomyces sp. NBC_00841]